MDWQVLTPDEFAEARARRTHVQVRGAAQSLCSAASELDLWRVVPDTHPEDVDPLERCSVCWSVYTRRNREERGFAPIPSNYLTAGRRR